jgi:hypothetical protein
MYFFEVDIFDHGLRSMNKMDVWIFYFKNIFFKYILVDNVFFRIYFIKNSVFDKILKLLLRSDYVE